MSSTDGGRPQRDPIRTHSWERSRARDSAQASGFPDHLLGRAAGDSADQQTSQRGLGGAGFQARLSCSLSPEETRPGHSRGIPSAPCFSGMARALLVRDWWRRAPGLGVSFSSSRHVPRLLRPEPLVLGHPLVHRLRRTVGTAAGMSSSAPRLVWPWDQGGGLGLRPGGTGTEGTEAYCPRGPASRHGADQQTAGGRGGLAAVEVTPGTHSRSV